MSNNKTNQNDPAFSCTDGEKFYDTGLTKREYFAAMALQGICANPNHIPTNAAQGAVQQADELIKALNYEQQ